MSHCSTCTSQSGNKKTKIDGVNLWTWSYSQGVYKNIAVGIDPSLYSKLVYWKRNLDYYSNGYSAGVLQSPFFSMGNLGIYNCRHIGQPAGTSCGSNNYDGPSYHSWSRAIDLSIIRWNNLSGPTCNMKNGDHASSSSTLRRRYIGVNAITLKYFKNTLNGWTPSHADHFHIDNALTVGVLDKYHKATVRFVQAACQELNGANLGSYGIDGSWGSLTTAAFNDANDAMCFNKNAFTSSIYWKAWCSMIAKHAFRNKTLGYYKYSSSCPL